MKSLLPFLTLATLAGAAPAFADNLVVNGSF